jgi:cell division GTPase FtsZ
LTKQTSDETVLKGHLALEEANKAVPSVTEAIVNNALVIRGAHNVEHEGELDVTVVMTRKNSVKSKLREIMPELYDIENGAEAEKPLEVDLDLYQMENY